jgi:ferric-dicitrate binding protein FerR (iron transport regulator)
MRAREPSVDDLLKDASFQRWAIGRANDEERRRWDRWIRQRAGRRETAREAARIVKLARFKPAEGSGADAAEGAEMDEDAVDAAWERLRRARHRRDRRSAPLEKASRDEEAPRKSHRTRRSSRPRRRHTAVRTWSRRVAAALMVVALVGVGLWWTDTLPGWGGASTETTIQTTYNERASLTLPGGTAITLNANSRLRLFVGDDGQSGRAVHLDGEAFFDVARLEGSRGHRPFLVHTEDGTVRVLGTRFNVARREGRTRVALNEGEVAVRAGRSAPESGSDSSDGASVTIRPGQLATFGPESEAIHVEAVNPEVYSSWTTGTLVFDETPVSTIAERIEHTYGIEVRAEYPRVLSETVSGQVENDLSVFISGLSRLLDRPVHHTEEAIIIK